MIKKMAVTLIIILIVILSGCQQNASTNNPIIPKRETHWENSTLTPTATAMVIFPSQTIVPTLSASDINLKIKTLMESNSNCSDPCFWGLKPRLNISDESVKSILLLADSNNYLYKYQHGNSTRYNAKFKLKENLEINLSFLEQDQVIREIHASLNGLYKNEITNKDWYAFRPDQIFNTYGIPDQIYVFLVSSPVAYSCYFIFSYDQFIIEFVGPDVIPSTNTKICLLADHNISQVDLWLGKELSNPPVVKSEWSIENISKLSKQDFYNLIVGDLENSCFYANFTQ